MNEPRVVTIVGGALGAWYVTDRRRGKAALHMVSAWASEPGIALGQVATEERIHLLERYGVPPLEHLVPVAGVGEAEQEAEQRRDAEHLVVYDVDQRHAIGDVGGVERHDHEIRRLDHAHDLDNTDLDFRFGDADPLRRPERRRRSA